MNKFEEQLLIAVVIAAGICAGGCLALAVIVFILTKAYG